MVWLSTMILFIFSELKVYCKTKCLYRWGYFCPGMMCVYSLQIFYAQVKTIERDILGITQAGLFYNFYKLAHYEPFPTYFFWWIIEKKSARYSERYRYFFWIIHSDLFFDILEWYIPNFADILQEGGIVWGGGSRMSAEVKTGMDKTEERKKGKDRMVRENILNNKDRHIHR